MSPRMRRVSLWFGGASLVLGTGAALAFGLRWSGTCEEERAQAREAWATYAASAAPAQAERARAVEAAIGGDLASALEMADDVRTAPPNDDGDTAVRYRDAMERLVLADGACVSVPSP